MLSMLSLFAGHRYRYKQPTEELSQRVESLNTLRTEKLNRVKLVEEEKDKLEGPKNEAVAYIKLENDLAQFKYNLQQVKNELDVHLTCKRYTVWFFLLSSTLINRWKWSPTVNKRNKRWSKKWAIWRQTREIYFVQIRKE